MKNWKTLLLGIAMIANTSFAAPQVVDKVAAVVNNGVVLESDVDGLMQSVKLNAAQARQQLPDDATLRHQIMERLIMDQIILQMGQKMGVKISDEQLDQAIANIAKQNNMTLDQMRSRLAYDGLNYNTYRNQIRKEMIISEVRNNEVRRRITILPQEVESLAQQVGNQNDASTELNLSNILIPLPENPTSDQVNEAESQARAIVDQARNGADFGKLAIAHSADQQALNGGQMGWGRIQELPGIFAQALSTAKKGDIVGPIRSGVGFHILKVNDLRGESKNISVTEVHARHILLKPSPIMTDEQARVKLEQIAADIKSGKTTFAAAAKDGCVYVKITGEINVKNLLIEDGRIGILYRENEVVAVYDRQINLPKELKRNDLYVETDRSVTAFYVSLSDSTPQFIETVKGSVETYAIFDIADGYIIAIPSKGRRDVENIICQVISGE